MARAKLGVAGLDAILHGGVVPGNAILVEGTPGAGKTTLGMQFIYAGITQHNEPGLIVTFEEFPSQMYRDAGMLGWDLQALANENKLKIISTSPAVFRQETAGPSGLITQMAREIGAERVMVDSISHFQRLTQDPAEQREIFNSLVNMLKRGGFTAMLTKEVKSRSGDEVSFEEYASDTALRLTYEVEASTQRARYVEVVKARGQDFIPGKHSFLIGRGGITVFPSVALSTDDDAAKAHIERIDSGIPGLDEMLHGGLIRAWSLLLVGPAGSGKTIFGLQS
ncbi:MAG TPA: ATPase domain-containing protein, partial [Armatimonadota bacterium]|nr:ATPase domain-containing protein [Armatimonadota bacterium]